MREIRLKKGLDLPLAGEPLQAIEGEKLPRSVALLGPDYVGMKPQFKVAVGDRVKLGQPVFTDKKTPGVRYTSPGAGTVKSIHRGEKRLFLSVVIELEGEEEETFPAFSGKDLASLDRKTAVDVLLESGLWTALRSRPFGRVADPARVPRSIFVTAMDSNPHAPSMKKVLEGREDDFSEGLKVVAALTDGKVYVCTDPETTVPAPLGRSIETVVFDGPHPAGNAGTHIHFLDPVGRSGVVWHIDAQDVAAIGALFTTGRLDVGRVVSLAGPAVRRPRLVRTRIGAGLHELVEGELKEGRNRIISGSVVSGYTAAGPLDYLGRYHRQVSALAEAGERRVLGWLRPGRDLFSVKNIFLSSLLGKKSFAFTTELHGDMRPIVPVGSYEKVMPLDILPTFLLKALAVNDVEEAEALGCLELVEEDLALCTLVCPSKIDHGANLRRTLTTMEKEG
jgi:Na+-transporting NADH:ubiquinone oxidoreductase subunit A